MHDRGETWMVIYSIYCRRSCYEEGAVIDKRLSKKYETTLLRNTGEQVEKYGTTYSGEIQGSSHRQEAGYGSVRKAIKLPISPHRTRPSYVPTKTSDAIYPLKPRQPYLLKTFIDGKKTTGCKISLMGA